MKSEWVAFAEEMFGTADSDYRTALYAWSGLPIPVRQTLYITDQWFYNLSSAVWLASSSGPIQLWERAGSEYRSLPRDSERRHFRGEKGWSHLSACYNLVGGGDPGQLVDLWFQDKTFEGFSRRIAGFPQVGPYFRCAMYEAAERSLPWLGLQPVTLDNVELYKSPLAGIKLLAEEGETVTQTTERVIAALRHIPAAPLYDRPFGAQEAETFFCRWKKYKTGHYHIGHDREAAEKQMGWRESYIDTRLQEVNRVARRANTWNQRFG